MAPFWIARSALGTMSAAGSMCRRHGLDGDHPVAGTGHLISSLISLVAKECSIQFRIFFLPVLLARCANDQQEKREENDCE